MTSMTTPTTTAQRDGSSGPGGARRPSVVVILADDLGFSDLSCFGGEIATPHLDGLAAEGHRLASFYTTARCSPSRASLLTGLYPHQTGIGILTQDDGPVGYPGTLDRACPTLAEVLRPAGYRTHISGKWHLARDRSTPNSAWPLGRGFDSHFGTLTGCGSFYDPGTLVRDDAWADDASDPSFFYTDALGADAEQFVRGVPAEEDFFLYLALTAPHWPLHATEDDIAVHRGRFDAGWDALREERLARQRELGVVTAKTELSDRDPDVPAWEDVADPAWQVSRMEAYAGQVVAMDRAIGQVLAALDETGRAQDTLVLFIADNGASAEELPLGDPATFHLRSEIVPQATRDGRPVRVGNDSAVRPGPEDTYASYGRGWANVSNTPFRLFKEYVHQGGVASPTIVRWPAGRFARGGVSHQPLHLVDVVPTVLEATGVQHPCERGDAAPPLEGLSALQVARGSELPERSLFFEHIGNAAVRRGAWKLVRHHQQPWELYHLGDDPTERDDVAASHPDLVADLAEQWRAWAARVGVKPYEDIVDAYAARGLDRETARGS